MSRCPVIAGKVIKLLKDEDLEECSRTGGCPSRERATNRTIFDFRVRTFAMIGQIALHDGKSYVRGLLAMSNCLVERLEKCEKRQARGEGEGCHHQEETLFGHFLPEGSEMPGQVIAEET